MALTDASAIITGGDGSFGPATVRRLAQKGAKVVIADVSDERARRRPGRSALAALRQSSDATQSCSWEYPRGCLGRFPTHIGAERLAEGPEALTVRATRSPTSENAVWTKFAEYSF
jgi:NAD(P)-dependent dehydrogenase (short-subunit alcohol dehydrogenase family)